MVEEKDQNEKKVIKQDIKIDYDNINVQDIMEQIQQKITAGTEELEDEAKIEKPPHLTPDTLPVPEPLPMEISRTRSIMLKIMSPFSRLIRLLVLPVHHSVEETRHDLHNTIQRLDYLAEKMDLWIGKLERRHDKSEEKLEDISRKVTDRLDHAFFDLGKTMEYTKLLHQLSHNMVVELSKLKIEEERLKIKTRIMEKDFEFLGQREKELEKEILR